MRHAPWAFMFLALLTVGACLAAPYDVVGNKVVSGDVRFTVLSPTLVRLESAPGGKFVDEPSVLVLNRDWAPCDFQVSEEAEWLCLRTSALELRWLLGTLPFSDRSLVISWRAGGKTGSWRPGMRDPANLGGTRGALDGIGQGNLPPLDPGLLSRDGWTLLDDSDRPLWLGDDGWLKPRPDYAARDWYFFAYGHAYDQMLRQYVTLCGKVPMLPRYSWGAWYSRYWAFRDQEERDIVTKFRALDIPLDVLVIDVDWHKYDWEGYDWNPTLFPDPAGFLHWVHQQGLEVTLNNHPGSPLPVEDTHHAEACQMAGVTGDAAKQPLGWNLADPKSNRAFVEAAHWPLEQMGINFWWIDGAAPSSFRGLSSDLWCAKTYYDGTGRRTGARSMVFSRYGGLGQHRYPAGFSGDVHSEWDVLNYEVRYTARAGNVLFPYWSHDIGGFLGDRLDPELYVRWCQFGALSPVLRLHSNHGVREPWNYGEEAQRIVRDYFRLRMRLYPYLNACQREVYETGMPLCRPLYLSWPDAPEAYRYDYEYLLGPGLLVAPVATHTAGGTAVKELWLPPGLWWDYWTGEPIQGPRKLVVHAALDRCPLFARAGAIVPMQPDMAFMGQKPADPLTLNLWLGADGAAKIYEDDGLTLDYQKTGFATTSVTATENGDELRVTVQPRQGSFQGAGEARAYDLQINGVFQPRSVSLEGEDLPMLAREPAPNEPPGWWRHDPATDRLVVSVPRRPVTEAFTVTVRARSAAKLAGLRAEARALRDCADAALTLARARNLGEDVLAKLDAVKSAGAAALAAIQVGDTPTAALRTGEAALRDAWQAVGASDLAEGKPEILRALVGFSTTAQLERLDRPGDFLVSVTADLALPLPDAQATFQPLVPEGWTTNAVSDEMQNLGPARNGSARFGAVMPRPGKEVPLGAVPLRGTVTLKLGDFAVSSEASADLDCSFVQLWHIIGPFANQGGTGLATVYPPETETDYTKTYPGVAGPVKWQTTDWTLPPTDDPAVFIDLAPRFQPKDQVTAYCVSYLLSDADADAVLHLGSDDGCKVWFNGKVVVTHPEPRPAAPDQDRANIRLNKGVNTVLFKVVNEGGQYGLYLQVTALDGKPLPGLRSTLSP